MRRPGRYAAAGATGALDRSATRRRKEQGRPGRYAAAEGRSATGRRREGIKESGAAATGEARRLRLSRSSPSHDFATDEIVPPLGLAW
jgi:hypothetical protein